MIVSRYRVTSVINQVRSIFEFTALSVIGPVSLDGDNRPSDWPMGRNFVRNTNFGIYVRRPLWIWPNLAGPGSIEIGFFSAICTKVFPWLILVPGMVHCLQFESWGTTRILIGKCSYRRLDGKIGRGVVDLFTACLRLDSIKKKMTPMTSLVSKLSQNNTYS